MRPARPGRDARPARPLPIKHLPAHGRLREASLYADRSASGPYQRRHHFFSRQNLFPGPAETVPLTVVIRTPQPPVSVWFAAVQGPGLRLAPFLLPTTIASSYQYPVKT